MADSEDGQGAKHSINGKNESPDAASKSSVTSQVTIILQ